MKKNNKEILIKKAIDLINSNLFDGSKLTAYRIATETRITEATIGNYKSGKTRPTAANAQIIIDYFEKINNSDKDGKRLNTESVNSDHSIHSKPFVDMAYGICGKPGGFDVQVMERDCEKLYIPFVESYDFSIRAKGDSMINRKNPQKSIRGGDILVCKKINSVEDVRMGEVYALCSDGDIVIKKLAPSQKDGYITCISFNEEDGYLPFDLSVNDIYGWALVKGVFSVNLW
ncbi:MAG: LexA family transcriptional regulator [Tannerella sp.]|jgi:SOS-response transcriptional repressor LexA|nr:LexA family transcriptional regulator [Tannerella sp.]